MNPLTPEHVEFIRHEIETLPADSSSDQINQAADQLETINYQPMLTVEPPDFLRISKEELLSFVDQLIADQESKELTEQDLSLLLHHYKLLQRLRENAPEAWDEISEVMEED